MIVSLGIVAVVLLAMVLLFLFEVVRQQGRILLRLESLEGRLPADESVAQDGAFDARPQLNPPLAVGESFPAFSLPDLAGGTVTLSDFAGRRLLLLHWSPSCAYCDLIADELAENEEGLREHGVDLLFASYGSEEENSSLGTGHEITSPFAIQLYGETLGPFRGRGTPVAYLLDGEGKVERELAFGADEVTSLVRELAQPQEGRRTLSSEKAIAESRIVRDGLKPGVEAPVFELEGINGEPVSLSDYRGRRVVLVFTDPACGPCESFCSELGHSGLAGSEEAEVIIVGRGTLEENRAKAQAYGIRFPYVVQQGWRLSKQYGERRRSRLRTPAPRHGARPVEGAETVQESGTTRRAAACPVPRSASHIRNAPGRGRRPTPSDSRVDGSPRLSDDQSLCRLRT